MAKKVVESKPDEETPIAPNDRVSVERKPLYRFIYAVVSNRAGGFTGMGGKNIMLAALGCKTEEEREKTWNDIVKEVG